MERAHKDDGGSSGQVRNSTFGPELSPHGTLPLMATASELHSTPGGTETESGPLSHPLPHPRWSPAQGTFGAMVSMARALLEVDADLVQVLICHSLASLVTTIPLPPPDSGFLLHLILLII